MRPVFLLPALCLLAQCTLGKAQDPAFVKRYAHLRKVVDHHVGHAHLTRGMNMDTILALGKEATADDIPVLAALMNDPDHVTAMTAAEVLPALGPDGIRAFKSAKTSLPKIDLDQCLGEAEATRRRIEAHKRSAPH